MNVFNRSLCIATALIFTLPVIGDSADAHKVTVKEVMEAVITPATNTLWGAEDPQTDEAWKELESAAIATVTAGTYVARGGSGESDREWSSEEEWQAFNTAMIEAAMDALTAIRARDIDALYDANDVLYPPCEGCHIAFNPGVQ
ncbi:MAG: hypothetical protein GXP15_14115 [Gammaproteobacteria bacterium]|nr:hypothetical protein [Gammaproteobacteria bacterium]